MQKKNLILIIILGISLLVLAIIYFSDNRKQQKDRVLRDFAVEDTATINKIFLVDMNKNSIMLERQENYWTVNKIYKARKDFVEVLLETIKRIEIKSPVPKAKIPKVLRDISSEGIKVEIYQNDKKVKTYYVGSSDENTIGTYMILENSDVPFCLYIPSFSGFLSIRYTTKIDEWRERIIFNYKVQDIAKISVSYPENPTESFIINSYGNNKYDLCDIKGTKINDAFDTLKIKEYITRMKFLGFETYVDKNIKQERLDSVINEPIISKFTIEDREGKTKTLKTYRRKNVSESFDDDGNIYEWDIDNLYGIIENDSEIIILQYYIIDPLSIKKSNFLIKN